MEFAMPVRPDLPARCAALTAVAALTLTGAAASADTMNVPLPGSVITLPEHAQSVVLTCNGKSYTLDLSGAGQLVVGSPTAVGDVSHVPVTTQIEDLIGYSPDLGEVTATERKPEVGDLAIGKVETDTMPMNLTFSIQNNPCRAATSPAKREPLVLATKYPGKLIGTLTQFPPKGDLYQLQNPVDLIDLENPDVTVATIDKFPVKVGGL
jgi:hypothetical protein